MSFMENFIFCAVGSRVRVQSLFRFVCDSRETSLTSENLKIEQTISKNWKIGRSYQDKDPTPMESLVFNDINIIPPGTNVELLTISNFR